MSDEQTLWEEILTYYKVAEKNTLTKVLEKTENEIKMEYIENLRGKYSSVLDNPEQVEFYEWLINEVGEIDEDYREGFKNQVRYAVFITKARNEPSTRFEDVKPLLMKTKYLR